jgi:hypothetical protein
MRVGKDQRSLVKVNQQMLTRPLRHLTVMLTNRAPVSHTSHGSRRE